MEVILKADVSGVGKKGQVLSVADGYARNYLLPRGLAVPVTAGRLKEIDREQDDKKKKELRALQEAERLAKKLEGVSLKIASRAGEGGKLFGSVTNKEVAQEILAKHHVEVDRRKIEMGPVKALGVHPVVLKLHPKVQAHIQIQVVAEIEKT